VWNIKHESAITPVSTNNNMKNQFNEEHSFIYLFSWLEYTTI
jgi:hypothetical protein